MPPNSMLNNLRDYITKFRDSGKKEARPLWLAVREIEKMEKAFTKKDLQVRDPLAGTLWETSDVYSGKDAGDVKNLYNWAIAEMRHYRKWLGKDNRVAEESLFLAKGNLRKIIDELR